MKKKVLVFGIDGGSFQSLRPWIENGSMPFLTSFLTRNYSTEIPCEINGALGWPTFISGKRPENHLCYYWMGRNHQSKIDNFIINSRFLGKETIWQVLSENSVRSSIVNVPITYPPFEVNGQLLSGPGGGLKFDPNLQISYPHNLIEELNRNNIIYQMKWNDVNSGRKMISFVDSILTATKSHVEAGIYLIDQNDVDFFMIVFRGHDAIQHRAYRYVESGSILKNFKLLDKIQSYYRLIDRGMERLFNAINHSENLLSLIVSDHGFGPCTMKVNIDNAFKRNKWLQYDYTVAFSKIMNRFLSKTSKKNFIDMKTTKVYRDSSNSVSINLKGRDPYGVIHQKDYEAFRSDVISYMKELSHPDAGKIFKKIMRPEDLNIEKEKAITLLKYFPDIVFQPNPKFHIDGGIRLSTSEFGKTFCEIDSEKMINWSGVHQPDGLFSIDSADVNQNIFDYRSFTLVDIAPTILKHLNIDTPVWMDGQSII